MTEDEFRRHRDGEGSPEEARDFFHMFMKKKLVEHLQGSLMICFTNMWM